MATARMQTRTVTEEVTTYTLELSGEEVNAFKQDYAVFFGERYEGATAIRQALSRSASEDNDPPAIGDRVRVLREWLDAPGDIDGKVGTLVNHDPSDWALTYKVEVDGWGADWVHSVERI